MFPDEFHLNTLDIFLGATAQLQGRVNVKQIVIALIDRLASYAAREAENESAEIKRKKEEEAAKRLAAKVQAARQSRSGGAPAGKQVPEVGDNVAGGEAESAAGPSKAGNGEKGGEGSEAAANWDAGATADGQQPLKPAASDNFRGIPSHVRLFEIFWQQVVDLIKVSSRLTERKHTCDVKLTSTKTRSDLPLQDITALLVSLANLAISCYPDRLEYVEQILQFALHITMAQATKSVNSPPYKSPLANMTFDLQPRPPRCRNYPKLSSSPPRPHIHLRVRPHPPRDPLLRQTPRTTTPLHPYFHRSSDHRLCPTSRYAYREPGRCSWDLGSLFDIDWKFWGQYECEYE